MPKTIGIDVGGTKIRGILWNGKRILKSREIKTPADLENFEKAISKIINYLGQENPVAIGAAGIVSGKRIIESPNIPYIKNFNFFGVKSLDNDARCFALAEAKLGRHFEKTALFFTIGTGFGRAAARNGKILRIKKFEYPEDWEPEYQKIKSSKNSRQLAKFLGEKIKKLAKAYGAQALVAGGGILERKGFLGMLKKEAGIPIFKSKFGRNAVAIGAILCYNSKFAPIV